MGPNETTTGGPDVCLTSPASIKQIAGDGNCFYRCIAQAITGSQSQHLAIRTALVDHMRRFGDTQNEYMGMTPEDYIASRRVGDDGIWATDIEIQAMSHMLKVNIYT